MEDIKDGRKKGWFWLENALVDREDLNPYERLLYMVLARHANDDGECFPSRERLKKVTGIKDERTITKYIKSLESKKLISIEKRKGLSNIYHIKNVPPTSDVPTLNAPTPPTSNVPTSGEPHTSHVGRGSDMKCTPKETNIRNKEEEEKETPKVDREDVTTKEILNLYKSLSLKPYEIPPIELIKSAIKKYGLSTVTKSMQIAAKNPWVCRNKAIDGIFDHIFIREVLNGKWDVIEKKPNKNITPTKDDKGIQEWLNS